MKGAEFLKNADFLANLQEVLDLYFTLIQNKFTMRYSILFSAVFMLLAFTGCAGGDNVAADTPADIQLTVGELDDFDEDKRAADVGKIGETTGIVISSKRAAPNEKTFGSHFIYIYTEKTPDEKFDPSISCYTWGNPGVRKGQTVTLKGNIGRGAAIGYSLLNCHVKVVK
jgi:hypothetical protein